MLKVRDGHDNKKGFTMSSTESTTILHLHVFMRGGVYVFANARGRWLVTVRNLSYRLNQPLQMSEAAGSGVELHKPITGQHGAQGLSM